MGTPTLNGILDLAGGIRLAGGEHIVPDGGRVKAYVRSGGFSDSRFPSVVQSLGKLTLNEGLAQCESGVGDVVMVWNDHTENVDTADKMSSLVAGTSIIGMGHGTLRPTFTWTAAAASFLLDVTNVRLHNLVLTLASSANGGVTVAAPITVSAAGCEITGCRINFGDDADDLVGQAIDTSGTPYDFVFANNRCFGATAAGCETFLNLVGTNRVRVMNNYIAGASSAVGVGLIRAESIAHANGIIYGNVVFNRKTASEEAITLMNGCTGFMDQNYLQVLDNASVAMDNDGDYLIGSNNWLANAIGERGVQLGTQSA